MNKIVYITFNYNTQLFFPHEEAFMKMTKPFLYLRFKDNKSWYDF